MNLLYQSHVLIATRYYYRGIGTLIKDGPRIKIDANDIGLRVHIKQQEAHPNRYQIERITVHKIR